MRRRPPALAIAVALLAALAVGGPGPGAQTEPPSSRPLQIEPARPPLAPPALGLSDSATASLLTMLPGREVYSLFGHSALRVRDDAAGVDRTYNFGTFSFDQPYFVLRFLRGSLDYSLTTAPFDLLLGDYVAQERPVIEQTLDVGPDVVRALYDRLETNALPANRDYRYDFFWDNCSTRLLDALDSALVASGHARLQLPETDSPQTFRRLLAPYLVGTPTVELGLNLALGAPGDRLATAREETFLPLRLADQLDRARLADRPLVARRDTLFEVPGSGLPEPAFPFPLVAGWVLNDGQAHADALYASDRDWVVVRPPRLTDKPPTGPARHGILPLGFAEVTRADVADFMLTEAVAPRYHRAAPNVTGP